VKEVHQGRERVKGGRGVSAGSRWDGERGEGAVRTSELADRGKGDREAKRPSKAMISEGERRKQEGGIGVKGAKSRGRDDQIQGKM